MVDINDVAETDKRIPSTTDTASVIARKEVNLWIVFDKKEELDRITRGDVMGDTKKEEKEKNKREKKTYDKRKRVKKFRDTYKNLRRAQVVEGDCANCLEDERVTWTVALIPVPVQLI